MKQPVARAGTLAYVERLCLQAQRLRAIPRLSIAAHGDPERLLSAVCSVAPALLDCDGIAVFVDDGKGALRVRAAAGYPEPFTRWARLSASDMAQATSADSTIVRLTGAPSEWPCPEALLQSGARVALWAPIQQRGRTTGGLLIGRNDAAAIFGDDDCLYAEVLSEFLSARLAELTMARRLDRMQRGVVRSARRAGLGDVAASVAQRLVASMVEAVAIVERTAAAMDAGPAREQLERLRSEAMEAEKTARALLFVGGAGEEADEVRRSSTPREILAAAAELLADPLASDGIRLEIHCDEGLPSILCEPAAIAQALLHLVSNARRSLKERSSGPAEGVVRLLARRVGATVELEVWDGAGAPPEDMRERGESGHSGRGRGSSGIGLAVCRDIARLHGGSLRVESEIGQWARFVLVLPAEGAA